MKLSSFGKEARILRIKCDTSLPQMAKDLGVTRQYLYVVEEGIKPLSKQLIDKYMEYFKGKGFTILQLKALYAAGLECGSSVKIKLDDVNRELIMLLVDKSKYLNLEQRIFLQKYLDAI